MSNTNWIHGAIRRAVWNWLGYEGNLPLTQSDMNRWSIKVAEEDELRWAGRYKRLTEYLSENVTSCINAAQTNETRTSVVAQLVANGRSIEDAILLADELIARTRK